MQKDVRAVLGLTLLLGAFTVACDNNPLRDNPDKGAFMYTNPSFTTVTAGKTVSVRANVMNKYSTSTGDAVTGTPCDAKITAVADTSRTPFEQPERFIITGVTAGHSCLIVTGGGVTDTVDVLVGPTAVDVTADSLLLSGQSKPLSVTFTNGGALNSSDVLFTSSNPAVVFVDTTTNTISGRAPGTTYVTATLRSNRGAIVKDSTKVTVTVGNFTGTAPASVSSGGQTTLTAGSIPFDANTTVIVNGVTTPFVTANTPTSLTFVTPAGLTGTTATVVVANLGPDEISQSYTATLNPETGETDTKAAPRPMTLGSTVSGTVSSTDIDDWYSITIPAGTSVTVDLDWAPGTSSTSDVDEITYRSSGSVLNGSCATGSKPEHCAFTISTAGTYTFNVEWYAGLEPVAYKLTVK